MENYFKIYPQFADFSKKLLDIDLEDPTQYSYSDREAIYDRLRLPIKMFKGKLKSNIDELVNQYFGLDDFVFSVIKSNSTSQIHTDTHYKKGQHLQRYCNLAFPISGDFTNRITFWPKLDKADKIFCFKNSYVEDTSLHKYKETSTWTTHIKHKLHQPVLLNTSEPHAAQGSGETLFAYITLIGKSYEECSALYDKLIL
jgi:hypothetical protein